MVRLLYGVCQCIWHVFIFSRHTPWRTQYTLIWTTSMCCSGYYWYRLIKYCVASLLYLNSVIKCHHQQTSKRNSQQHRDNRQIEHMLTEAILLVLLQRQSWLRTTVWPGWIRTVGSDWATPYMRHQPLTMEPRTHAGTRSSSVQYRLGWTPFTWKYLMRWGAHRAFSYTFTETDN